MEESFLVAIEFVTKVQVKGLTHMFCLLMSSYKVYKEGILFEFHIKKYVSFGWAQRSLTSKGKALNKIKVFTQLPFNSPIFLPSYLDS